MKCTYPAQSSKRKAVIIAASCRCRPYRTFPAEASPRERCVSARAQLRACHRDHAQSRRRICGSRKFAHHLLHIGLRPGSPPTSGAEAQPTDRNRVLASTKALRLNCGPRRGASLEFDGRRRHSKRLGPPGGTRPTRPRPDCAHQRDDVFDQLCEIPLDRARWWAPPSSERMTQRTEAFPRTDESPVDRSGGPTSPTGTWQNSAAIHGGLRPSRSASGNSLGQFVDGPNRSREHPDPSARIAAMGTAIPLITFYIASPSLTQMAVAASRIVGRSKMSGRHRQISHRRLRKKGKFSSLERRCDRRVTRRRAMLPPCSALPRSLGRFHDIGTRWPAYRQTTNTHRRVPSFSGRPAKDRECCRKRRCCFAVVLLQGTQSEASTDTLLWIFRFGNSVEPDRDPHHVRGIGTALVCLQTIR